MSSEQKQIKKLLEDAKQEARKIYFRKPRKNFKKNFPFRNAQEKLT
jgi:hypothetical protein